MTMRKFLLLTTAAFTIASWEAKAQTDLTAYVDANGFLNVQGSPARSLPAPGKGTPTR